MTEHRTPQPSTASGTQATLRRGAPHAFSLLELTVAMLVFGVAMSGLIPLLLMQSKGLKKLESRYPMMMKPVQSGDTVPVRYIVPSSDVWARKLGASASLQVVDPATTPTVPASVVAIDDGDAEHTEPGAGWLPDQDDPDAYVGDCSMYQPPLENPTSYAWTFTSVTPGWYEIQATWPGSAEHTIFADYTIIDGTTEVHVPPINQQAIPEGPLYNDRHWKILKTLCIASGTLRVELRSTDTTSKVVADGVRLVPFDKIKVLSITKSLTGEQVTAQVSVEPSPE
jgi:prepilin-type N-terminal cleavage/methylation domain-containing protein